MAEKAERKGLSPVRKAVKEAIEKALPEKQRVRRGPGKRGIRVKVR